LIRQLGMFVDTVQARFHRLEALLAMHPGPSPSDPLESRVDYFIVENVPISHVDGQFFCAVLCWLDPTFASYMPNAHQLRRSSWDELWPFVNP
jgi:hypothetical protein